MCRPSLKPAIPVSTSRSGSASSCRRQRPRRPSRCCTGRSSPPPTIRCYGSGWRRRASSACSVRPSTLRRSPGRPGSLPKWWRRRTSRRSRASGWRDADHLSQPLEQRALSCVDLLVGCCEREPFCTVVLREGLALAAARRPFHLESVAANAAHVEVELGRERGDDLSAALLDLAKRSQRHGQLKSKLLGKLPSRGGFCVFFVGILALRDRPGAEVLVAPERPAGMNEQDLDLPALPIGNDPGTSRWHRRFRAGGAFAREKVEQTVLAQVNSQRFNRTRE